MYCPICSTKVSVDQKFCRSCGFGLEKTVQSVSEQHPTDLALNLEEQKNKLERLGVIALSIFGIGVIGFFLYMVGYKVMSLLAQGKMLAALGLIGLTIILGVAFSNTFRQSKRGPRAVNQASSTTNSRFGRVRSHGQTVAGEYP
jgi:hypothetical protein